MAGYTGTMNHGPRPGRILPREAETTLRRYARGFPVICITGPRQSGKTTLSKLAFPEKPYLSLEDPDIAMLARSDPRGLLDNYPAGLILDEAQYAPEIFPYLKTKTDENPSPGKYIVTGSQQFDLLKTITESLAGRSAFLTLLPFSMGELNSAGLLEDDPLPLMLKGFYPPLYDRRILPYDWYTAYIGSYLERDVRSIINVKDLGRFRNFLVFCAVRNGSLLNTNSLSIDCGVSHNTVTAWLSVLETSGIIFLLRPYHRNFGKRLVKTPKLYFTDTGLACRVLRITNRSQLFSHPDRGHLFESFIVSDILKTCLNRGLQGDLYFWRDKTGAEVDLIIEDGTVLKSVEIKSGKTLPGDAMDSLVRWQKISGASPQDCFCVYAGSQVARNGEFKILPWRNAAETLCPPSPQP
jgi:predicted AAA+ superfamily ATPase